MNSRHAGPGLGLDSDLDLCADTSGYDHAAAAVALFLLYVAITPGHYQSSDGMIIFHQARSLLHDGAVVFREPFVFDQAVATSMYGIGLSLAYLPGLLLASGLETWVYSPGPALWQWQRVYGDPVYALVGWLPQHLSWKSCS
jgi:hypothetical protein